jgi:hypothetical protein
MVELKPLIYTAFGWVLGLLSTIFVQWLNKRRLKKDFKKGLIAQLKEVIPRLTGTTYILSSNLGKLDKDILEWINSIISKFGGDFPEKYKGGTESLLKLTEEQLATLSLITRQADGKASFIKNINLPFLEVNILSFTLFGSDFQRSLFSILARINMLNEEIDRNNFYYEKTFDSTITRENWLILDGNTKKGYENIIKICRYLAESIIEILKELQ